MKNYILSYEKYSVINKLPNIHQGLESTSATFYLRRSAIRPRIRNILVRSSAICTSVPSVRVAAASEGRYVRCVSAAQYVKTTPLIVALNSERRTNSIIEKNRFFQNENRFLEKKKLTSLNMNQVQWHRRYFRIFSIIDN